MNVKNYLLIFIVLCSFLFGATNTAPKIVSDTTNCIKEKKRADSLQQLVFVYELKEIRTKKYLKIAEKNKQEAKYLRGWLNRVWQ